MPVPSFQWAAATDPLDEHTPAEVAPRGTSSSAVSRRFVALSAKRLRSFLSRPLGELDLRVVCIDGRVFQDHCMVVALGIDTRGWNHVLGLREGATETAAVTTGLLSDLVTHGLPTDPALVFVIDGAPGLRRAISDVFGSRGVVQRCQNHKLRNVMGHLRILEEVEHRFRPKWNIDSGKWNTDFGMWNIPSGGSGTPVPEGQESGRRDHVVFPRPDAP